MKRLVVLALVALLLIFGTPASANHGPLHEHGRAGQSHGPDSDPRFRSSAKGQSTFDTAALPAARPVACAPAGANRTQAVYVYRDTNRLESVRAQLRSIIEGANGMVNDAAARSGGVSADIYFACDATNAPLIAAVRNTYPTNSFADIYYALQAAGYDKVTEKYMVFMDGTHPGECGRGNIHGDERLALDNINNGGPDYGMSWSGCWGIRTALHEWGHNVGAVQLGAPNSDGSWHCREGHSTMCYGSGMTYPCASETFDCNFNDYFDAAPERGEYLETHWNLGHPFNRFVRFGGSAPACADGKDNDSDGLIDFPADKGCTGTTDVDETDPPSPPVADPSPHHEGLSFFVGVEHKHPDGLATDPNGDLERFDWSFNSDKSDSQVTGVFQNTAGYISGYRAVLPGPKMTALTTGKAVYTLMVRDRSGRTTSVDHVECFWPC